MKSHFTLYKGQVFVFFTLLLLATNSYGQGRLEKHIVTDGYEYIAYLPEGYNESFQTEWPVLIYLHGGQGIKDGEEGFNNLNFFDFGIPALIDNLLNPNPDFRFRYSREKWNHNEFVVIVPHLPRDEIAFPTLNNQLWDISKLDKVLQHAFLEFNEDLERIYLTGISLGAKGVWDFSMAYPDIPAAIVPISGTGILLEACKIKDIPVWGFHGEHDYLDYDGESDTQEGRWGTKSVIDEINGCNPSPNYVAKFTLFPLKIHEPAVWDNVYNLTSDYNIYDWLLRFEKNSNANVAPVVTAGGMDKNVLLGDFPVILYGDAFDPEGSSLSYDWEYSASSGVIAQEEEERLVINSLPTGTHIFEFSAYDGTATTTDGIIIEVYEEPGSELHVPSIEIVNNMGVKIEPRSPNIYEVNTSGGGNAFKIAAQVPSSTRGVRWTLNENQNIKSTDVWSENDSPDGKYYFTFNNLTYWTPTAGIYQITITPFKNDKPLRNPGISRTITIGVNTPIILPVEFLEVSAARTGDQVTVKWSTASEEGNDFFTIERSPTASDNFEGIGTINGAGDSKSIKKYSFTDFAPLSGDAYYRIRQTDFDGKSDFSKIVKVNGTDVFDANLFPNPVNDGATFLEITSPDFYNPVSVLIVDAIGNRVFHQKFAPELLMKEEGYKLLINNYLSKGIYFVIIQQGGNILQKKLLVN